MASTSQSNLSQSRTRVLGGGEENVGGLEFCIAKEKMHYLCPRRIVALRDTFYDTVSGHGGMG